jgi:hypothetical protein
MSNIKYLIKRYKTIFGISFGENGRQLVNKIMLIFI